MAFPPRPRAHRTFLRVENLEDRITPSFNASLPLDGQVATHDIMGDRLVVTLQPGATAASAGLTSVAGVTQAKSIGFGIYSVRLAAGTSLDAAQTALAARPGVQYAEADPIVTGLKTPNDPLYSAMYAPQNISAPAAWNITTGNPNFVVAVIDSGIDLTHPDLAPNLWTNPGEIPGNGIDDDGDGYVDDVHGYNFFADNGDPTDDDGNEQDGQGNGVYHGTHVSGTIGAVGNNGVGVTGVDWNVKIMALKVLGPDNFGSYSGIINAISFSVQMGVKLTNNSYGGSTTIRAFDRVMQAVHDAGQIFVVAAGNGGADSIGDNNDYTSNFPTNYAAKYDNVISVAATDQNDQLADFSNYGANSVTLAAPGVHILSTLPGGGYHYLQGTSMATPQVTGALALYWGANPNSTYQEVVNVLKRSVDKLPQLAGKMTTGGRLDVAKMFDYSFGNPIVVNAPAGTDTVQVLGVNGTTMKNLDPYPGFLGGVVAASGDVNGDGVADYVTAASLGGHVKVFDGSTGALLMSFLAFPGYQGPVSVTIGDLTGDGIGDIIVSANLNGHVKMFNGQTGAVVFSQLVYDGYRGAVQLATADLNGNGSRELVTAADGGAGVHVKSYRLANGGYTLLDSFIATTPAPKQWGGNFSLAASDLDADGIAELVVSTGPRVKVIDSKTKATKADFIAYDPLSGDNATVQIARYNGDLLPELVVVRQTQGTSQVRVYNGSNYSLQDEFTAGSR